jgi:methylenetetrahydrofolate reductase (NADPH)
MKVIDHINQAKRTLFSFEILPPLKGKGIEAIYAGIDPLLEFDPSFINVTYHREEYSYKNVKDDLLQKVSIRRRPGTVGICAAIMFKYGIDTVPHLICGGFSKEETESALIDLQFLGIDNVLALRGDPIPGEKHFIPEKGGHAYASSLVRQISNLNNGIYLHEEIENESKSNFCIGVAGYPEKHFEAINRKTDLRYLKQKVDAGADYIITQIFYDNQKYFDFVDLCRKEGINVPIIPGLKPITNKNHIQFIPKTFNIDFPDELGNELELCKTDAEVNEVGVNWSVKQAKELIEANVPVVHFYTMGRSQAVRSIALKVF